MRRQTVARVEEEVRRIGLVRDAAAANLARKKDYAFVSVLPKRSEAIISTIARAVTDAVVAMRRDWFSVSLFRVRMDDPHVVVWTMIAIIEDGVDGQAVDGIAVMAPETAQRRDATHHARARDMAIITFVSDQPSTKRDRFVGIDDRAAWLNAATLVGRFSRREASAVVEAAQSMQPRDSLDRRQGFDEVMAAEYPWLAARPAVETVDRCQAYQPGAAPCPA